MEIENLEKLSNAELRAKCLEAGLPNVPITDSSRNVMVKRLRASLGGGTPISQQTKAKRRTTINIKTQNANVTQNDKDKDYTPTTQRSRSTIAAKPRSSVHGYSKSKPIVEETSVTIQRKSVDGEEPVPYIILDSDDEDNELMWAAEKAERTNEPPHMYPTARPVTLSKTKVASTSYNMAPQSHFEADELDRVRLSEGPVSGDHYHAINTQRFLAEATALKYNETNPYGPARDIGSLQFNPLERTSDYLKRTAYVPERAAFQNSAMPSYKATLSNVSQPDKDECYETPYLSNFARNLERLKTQPPPIGEEVVSRRVRPRLSEIHQKNNRSTEEPTIRDLFVEYIISVEEKYHVKRYFALILTVLITVFLYVVFFL